MYDNSKANNIDKLDDATVLQIDGGIITGLLVFLTLTSLIPIVSGPFGNTIAIVMTASVIFPFAISAIMVLSNHFKISKPLRMIGLDRLIFKLIKYSKYARNATFWGFVYLMIDIVFLFFVDIVSSFFPDVVPLLPSSIRQVCEKNLEAIDMTLDLCARIKPGSLYEECVKNTMPNLSDVKECSKFMTT